MVHVNSEIYTERQRKARGHNSETLNLRFVSRIVTNG